VLVIYHFLINISRSSNFKTNNSKLNAWQIIYKNPFRTSQETHYVTATKPNRLMLFKETVAVYCENHTEHTDTLCRQKAVYINSVRTSQETHYVSATKPNRLMLSGETVAVYCENHTEHTDTLCGRNAEFNASKQMVHTVITGLWRVNLFQSFFSSLCRVQLQFFHNIFVPNVIRSNKPSTNLTYIVSTNFSVVIISLTVIVQDSLPNWKVHTATNLWYFNRVSFLD
jgi:hypothetical protein